MTSHSTLKYYPRDDFDQNQLQETFFSPCADLELYEDLVIFSIKQLLRFADRNTGESLIDFSLPAVFQLQPLTKGFNNITILRPSDSSIADLKKWMKKEPGATDTSQTSRIVAALDGSSDWEEKEESLRQRDPNVLKCDMVKDNPTEPVVLEKADCFLSLFMLDLVSKDHDAFCGYIKKISSMLREAGVSYSAECLKALFSQLAMKSFML